MLRLPALCLLLPLALPASATSVKSLRFLSIDKNSARVALSFDEAASASIAYGEQPLAWTANADSNAPATEHEILLDRLIPDRQYFYQVLADGQPVGDVLTFQGGRSWVVRRLKVLVTGETSNSRPATRALAERLFSEEADVLLALGGDGGDPESFAEAHARSMKDRLVLEAGGASDLESPRLVQAADVAFALLGNAALTTTEAQPSAPLTWAARVLPEAEGACWRILVTGRVVEPGSPEASALQATATSSAADLVISRSASAGLSEFGPSTWLRMGGTNPAGPLHAARIQARNGSFSVQLLDDEGAELNAITRSRTCPLPKLKFEAASHESADGDEAETSSAEGLAEDCDSH